MQPPPMSSLLPPSESLSPAEIAERAVLRESERGERLMAWVRVLFTTSGVIVLMLTQALPELRGHAIVRGQVWLPVLLAPAMLFGWTWLVLLRRLPYRVALSRVSAATDCGFLVAFMILEIAVRGSPVAEGTMVGAVPTFLVLLVMIAGAILRQDMWACAIAGGVAVAGAACAVIYAHHIGPATPLPPSLAIVATGGAWVGRLFIVTFMIVIAVLAARNARRMARSTGLAMAEQDKITQLFGRYVDPEIARDVMAREGTVPRTIEVTVLFTDLRDFTSMSERMDPADVLDALNDHLRAIVPVVHKHGGTVNKFIGDAIMVTFGAPLRHDDHARRAVAAAREMLRAMEMLNEDRKRLARPTLQMGIGIATGPVVVGTLGTDERVEYAVIGDTVNTASRLEGLSKEFGTTPVVSARTHDAAGEGLPWRALGDAAVKGKTERVQVWTIE